MPLVVFGPGAPGAGFLVYEKHGELLVQALEIRDRRVAGQLDGMPAEGANTIAEAYIWREGVGARSCKAGHAAKHFLMVPTRPVSAALTKRIVHPTLSSKRAAAAGERAISAPIRSETTLAFPRPALPWSQRT